MSQLNGLCQTPKMLSSKFDMRVNSLDYDIVKPFGGDDTGCSSSSTVENSVKTFSDSAYKLHINHCVSRCHLNGQLETPHFSRRCNTPVTPTQLTPASIELLHNASHSSTELQNSADSLSEPLSELKVRSSKRRVFPGPLGSEPFVRRKSRDVNPTSDYFESFYDSKRIMATPPRKHAKPKTSTKDTVRVTPAIDCVETPNNKLATESNMYTKQSESNESSNSEMTPIVISDGSDNEKRYMNEFADDAFCWLYQDDSNPNIDRSVNSETEITIQTDCKLDSVEVTNNFVKQTENGSLTTVGRFEDMVDDMPSPCYVNINSPSTSNYETLKNSSTLNSATPLNGTLLQEQLSAVFEFASQLPRRNIESLVPANTLTSDCATRVVINSSDVTNSNDTTKDSSAKIAGQRNATTLDDLYHFTSFNIQGGQYVSETSDSECLIPSADPDQIEQNAVFKKLTETNEDAGLCRKCSKQNRHGIRNSQRQLKAVANTLSSVNLFSEENEENMTNIVDHKNHIGDRIRHRNENNLSVRTDKSKSTAIPLAATSGIIDSAIEHRNEQTTICAKDPSNNASVQPTSIRNTKLYRHQRQGLDWMLTREGRGFLASDSTCCQLMHPKDAYCSLSDIKGGVLADDTGLGKTAMVIALIEETCSLKLGPSLIVCPTSIVRQWEKEFKKFNTQKPMRVCIYGGSESQYHSRYNLTPSFMQSYCDVIITSSQFLSKPDCTIDGSNNSLDFIGRRSKRPYDNVQHLTETGVTLGTAIAATNRSFSNPKHRQSEIDILIASSDSGIECIDTLPCNRPIRCSE